MSCNIPVAKGVKKESECKCYGAVMKAYQTLLRNEPAHVAMEAAQRVYRYHHPEDSKHAAHLTVERWVSAEHIH